MYYAPVWYKLQRTTRLGLYYLEVCLTHEDITYACIYSDALATPASPGTSPEEGGFATCPSPHLRFPSPLRFCTGVKGGAGGSLTSFVLSPEVLRGVYCGYILPCNERVAEY